MGQYLESSTNSLPLRNVMGRTELTAGLFCEHTRFISVPEPVLFGRSLSRCEGPI